MNRRSLLKGIVASAGTLALGLRTSPAKAEPAKGSPDRRAIVHYWGDGPLSEQVPELAEMAAREDSKAIEKWFAEHEIHRAYSRCRPEPLGTVSIDLRHTR